jgi:hypothetical protein
VFRRSATKVATGLAWLYAKPVIDPNPSSGGATPEAGGVSVIRRIEQAVQRVIRKGLAVLRRGALPSDLQRQETARAVVGPGMQVASGGGDAGMSEGGLHQVNGRPTVEGMRGVGVAEPMR